MFTDIYIETERLVVRPFTLGDRDPLYTIVSQEEVMRYLPEGVMSREETLETLSWIIDCYGKNTPEKIIKFTVAVDLRETNELIGWCGLGPLAFLPWEIEIFYGVTRRLWNRGIATEAAEAMLEYGFSGIGLKRIVGVVYPENRASKRVLEKAGMKYDRMVTGLPPEHEEYQGVLSYSLTADEWSSLEGRSSRAHPD